jgi:hypothetical protein
MFMQHCYAKCDDVEHSMFQRQELLKICVWLSFWCHKLFHYRYCYMYDVTKNHHLLLHAKYYLPTCRSHVAVGIRSCRSHN